MYHRGATMQRECQVGVYEYVWKGMVHVCA